jgi:hypothetical protein
VFDSQDPKLQLCRYSESTPRAERLNIHETWVCKIFQFIHNEQNLALANFRNLLRTAPPLSVVPLHKLLSKSSWRNFQRLLLCCTLIYTYAQSKSVEALFFSLQLQVYRLRKATETIMYTTIKLLCAKSGNPHLAAPRMMFSSMLLYIKVRLFYHSNQAESTRV